MLGRQRCQTCGVLIGSDWSRRDGDLLCSDCADCFDRTGVKLGTLSDAADNRTDDF